MNKRWISGLMVVGVIGASMAAAQLRPFDPAPDRDRPAHADAPLPNVGKWQMTAVEDGTDVVLFVINTNNGRVYRLQDAGGGNRGRWEQIRNSQ